MSDSRGRRLAELFALTGFAVAQPVLDVTGRSPDFFLFRQPSIAEMWVLVGLLVLGPPLLLWAAEIVAGVASRTAERALHLLFLAGLLTVVVVQVGKQNDFYGRYLAAAALVAGCAVTVLLARVEKVREVVGYASPAPVVFVLLFALTAPAGALLRPAKEGAAAAAEVRTQPPIVVMVLDEFPVRALLDEKGAVDARLFPGFARLAKASTWYRNATAVSGFTPYAVPPILTGRFPKGKVAPSHVEHPDNLFTLLRDTYRVNAFETISQLCPPTQCTGNLPPGRATGLRALLSDTFGVTKDIVSPRKPKPREGEEFAEQADDDHNPVAGQGELDPRFRFAEGKKNQPERVTSFLASLGTQSDKPVLSFLHLLLPHVPWKYVPSGLTYGEHPPSFPLGRAKEGDSLRRNEEPGAMAVTQQRMLLQLAYTDGLLEQILDRLEQTGTWDETLFVLTADHGAGLTSGQRSRHLDTDNAPDLAYTPLFVKYPQQKAGTEDDRNAMNVDILPTIADALDVTVPFKTDGVSLLGTPRKDLAKQWFDTPGEALPIDGARWRETVRTGYAAALARPELGPEGLFAAGPHRALFGRETHTFITGAKAAVTARAVPGFTVDKASGTVPALLWGDLSGSLGTTTWLAVSVNGTIAGSVVAAPSRKDGSWHFVGIVSDEHFTPGRNDVRLWTVDGNTLHPLDWRS